LSKKTFVPAFSHRSMIYTIDKKSSHVWQLSVGIPAAMVNHVKNHVTDLYRHYSIMPGLSCNSLPLAYTQTYFAQEIEREAQQFLLNHFVEESVQIYLKDQKIAIVNWPRLQGIRGSMTEGYTFTLSLSLAPTVSMHNWQQCTFVAPKRKNYTDLDIQVEAFIETFPKKSFVEKTVHAEEGDWIRFSAQFRSPKADAAIHSKSFYWIRLTLPVLSAPAMHAFLNCGIGATFHIPANALSSVYATNVTQTEYLFDIQIQDIIKADAITLGTVQECLHANDHTSLHDKLIEIFSFRNDVSLRRSIIEELFYSLLNAFRFDIPPHAITRRKELLHFLMQQSPDNSVYLRSKHFDTHMTLLAEAKLKEEALIDSIAREEDIAATPEDITHYLSLASNERLKEFLYFLPLHDDPLSSEHPYGEYILEQTVRREKTLNHLIKRLAL